MLLRRPAVYLALLLIMPLAAAQTVTTPQDLVVTTLVPFMTHAGDLAVDGQGNIWVVETQSAVGGGTASLTRVSPAGGIVPNVVTGLSEIGDLTRGSDGNIYFWMNIGPGQTSLNQVTPTGGYTQLAVLTGFEGLGIAEASPGTFYMGTRATAGASGIWSYTVGGGPPTFVATGVDFGTSLPLDQEHLAVDGQGVIHAANEILVVQVTGPTTSIILHQVAFCAAPFCPPRIRDLDLGYHGDVTYVQHFAAIIPFTGLFGVGTPMSSYNLVNLGDTVVPKRPGVARGINNDFYLMSRSGTLSHVTGTPATLGVQGLGTAQISVTVKGPPASPILLGADVLGLEFIVPGIGALHTSLGTLPTFVPVEDGIGVFGPADPADQTPFTQTYNVPAVPVNVALTLEAYVLNGAALNGIVMISNPVPIFL